MCRLFLRFLFSLSLALDSMTFTNRVLCVAHSLLPKVYPWNLSISRQISPISSCIRSIFTIRVGWQPVMACMRALNCFDPSGGNTSGSVWDAMLSRDTVCSPRDGGGVLGVPLLVEAR